MTMQDVRKLPNGVYRVFWDEAHGGGKSVAALGRDEHGWVWLAPANWVSAATKTHWFQVERMELIATE